MGHILQIHFVADNAPKDFIFHTDLLPIGNRHDAHNTCLCLLIANIFVRDREGSKPQVMQHEDLDIVQLVAFWYIRLKDVDIEVN